jgi:hypothetical protein
MPPASIPITLWPATPILPPAQVNRSGWHGPPLAEFRPLRPEWVLRDLFEVDLDSDEQLKGLLTEHGAMSRPFGVPGMVPVVRRQLLAPATADPEYADPLGRRQDGTLEDARWWLKALRAMVAMWRNVNFGLVAADAWGAEGFLHQDGAIAWTLFVVFLNDGLEPFRARAYVRYTDDDGTPLEWFDGIFPVDLYSAGCQQFFNFVVSGAAPRRCENERCGRTFIHQLGGAGNWHRTKGLRFCTPECAKAETQRQYRRRQKEQKASNA